VRAQEVVRRYANTLIEASTESGVDHDAMRGDVEGIVATLNASAELVEFVRNPLIQLQTKREGLEQVFQEKVLPLTLNFIRLLVHRRRVNLLPDIAQAYIDILDVRSGVAIAHVTSAVTLNAEQEDRLRTRLAKYTGRQIRIEANVDSGLKGGLVARIDDVVFDGSVETQLERLRAQLMGS